MPRLEDARYKYLTSCSLSTSLLTLHVTHTLAHTYRYPSSLWACVLNHYEVSALRSRGGWTSARNNEQTNKWPLTATFGHYLPSDKRKRTHWEATDSFPLVWNDVLILYIRRDSHEWRFVGLMTAYMERPQRCRTWTFCSFASGAV